MNELKKMLMTNLYSAAINGIALAKEEITKEQFEERIDKLAEKILEDQTWEKQEYPELLNNAN